MPEHFILGVNDQDVETQKDIWLSENPAVRVLKVHQIRQEPKSLLTRLGGKNLPRVSITVEYEDFDVAAE